MLQRGVDYGLCREELARGIVEVSILRLDLDRSREREAMHAQSAQSHLEALDAHVA
jgi:hypothetical protein